MNNKFCVFVCLSVCLPDTPLTQVTLALHRYIIPLWNQDDPRIENLFFSFGSKTHCRMAIGLNIFYSEEKDWA